MNFRAWMRTFDCSIQITDAIFKKSIQTLYKKKTCSMNNHKISCYVGLRFLTMEERNEKEPEECSE